MPKLGVFSGSDICEILEANGFRKVRHRRTSHAIMQKNDSGRTITVPVPQHKSMKIGTLQSIIRQSELPRELFLK
jgi:predicted RNA binding protein YcfA (HicA-like mRNA interferase family)